MAQVTITTMTDKEFEAFRESSARRTEKTRAYLESFGLDPNAREGIVIPTDRRIRPYPIFDAE